VGKNIDSDDTDSHKDLGFEGTVEQLQLKKPPPHRMNRLEKK